MRRLFPATWVVPYWLAQVAGAGLAAALLVALFGGAADAGVNRPHVADGTAVVLELLLTAILATVILGTADRASLIGPNAAIAVGATIGLCGLIALPIEGASMNPARSLGPALANGELGVAWIYLLGPAAGSVVAVGIARFLHGPPDADGKPREAAQGDQRG